VSFLFPHCTTYCPLMARDLALPQKALAAESIDSTVEIVTFNVDPGGAGQAAAFLEQYGAASDPAASPACGERSVPRRVLESRRWRTGRRARQPACEASPRQLRHQALRRDIRRRWKRKRSATCSPARTRPPKQRSSTLSSLSSGLRVGNSRRGGTHRAEQVRECKCQTRGPGVGQPICLPVCAFSMIAHSDPAGSAGICAQFTDAAVGRFPLTVATLSLIIRGRVVVSSGEEGAGAASAVGQAPAVR
jgi:hypothetical protein